MSQYRILHINSMTNAVIPSQNRPRMSPEERQAQLLAVAITIYGRMGVERAGHGDVAKLAGVSTATVFNYFPTRDALTDAVLNAVKSHVRDSFDSTASVPTGTPRLLALAATFKTLIDNQPDIVKVLLNWSVSFGVETRPRFLEFQEETLNLLHDAISDDARDGHKGERANARIIFGAATTLAMMKLDGSAPETIATFIERVVNIISD